MLSKSKKSLQSNKSDATLRNDLLKANNGFEVQVHVSKPNTGYHLKGNVRNRPISAAINNKLK
jgi:hypothetical protein